MGGTTAEKFIGQMIDTVADRSDRAYVFELSAMHFVPAKGLSSM